MALNRFMHSRNRYKDTPPDFAKLAAKYPEFKEHVTISLNGKVSLDFKNPEALRALTCTLLKEDFGIDLDVPLDRLVPTIPLRLNYIHWIEDLIQDGGIYKGNHIHGIDIGTGASCIYPLLGVVLDDWQFVATEFDPVNIQYARENVSRNSYEDKIRVFVTSEDNTLSKVLEEDPRQCYTFCMCNPPFYGSPLEAQGLVSRSDDRPEPRSINTAAESESIAEGGEVTFVRRIIADSLKYKERVRWYTSMLGKKKSLVPLKAELQKHKVRNVATTEFCQGRTLRWGIAWTFAEDVSTLPMSPLKKFKKEKEKPPMVFTVPEAFVQNAVERLSITQAVQNKPPAVRLLAVQKEVETIMRELQIQYKLLNNKGYIFYELTAFSNTWSNQRKKRREAQRKGREVPEKRLKMDEQERMDGDRGGEGVNGKGEGFLDGGDKVCDGMDLSEKAGAVSAHGDDTSRRGDGERVQSETREKEHLSGQSCVADGSSGKRGEEGADSAERIAVSEGTEQSSTTKEQSPQGGRTDSSTASENRNTCGSSTSATAHAQRQDSAAESGSSDSEHPLLKCTLTIKNVNKEVVMEMKFLEGKGRDLIHQVAQYFKNQFPKRIQLSPAR